MRIKICGLTTARDIAAANRVKPDYIGFVFAESRRMVTFEQAHSLRGMLSTDIVPVGVFRNAPVERVAAAYAHGMIAMAQLHGCEDAGYIRALKRLCDIPIIQAVKVRSQADIARVDGGGADFLLLDSGGGTGKPFDWREIGTPRTPYFLAGGINADNLREAVALHPYAVDISSGAERDGRKDLALMQTLVELVREGGHHA